MGIEPVTARERLTPASALEQLDRRAPAEFVTLFEHGSASVEIYRPRGVDRQKPHDRDEIYVIISGSGFFMNGAHRRPFVAGEVLFVEAGAEHRFEEFSDDFATWVLFYGPMGGEK